jgi:hypothetical protein
VKDPWNRFGTITFVDVKARGGMGRVRVKMDDGSEHDRACVATGLEIVGN